MKKRINKISSPAYFTLSLSLNADLGDDQVGVFYAVFEEISLSHAAEKRRGGWEFLWTFDHAPKPDDIETRFNIIADILSLDPVLLIRYRVEQLPDKDWLAESYRALPAFTLGPFFIYGSHYDGEIPQNTLPLLIEAATAFGSGTHGTTAGCLLALAALKDQGLKPNNILDMGCGSGILAAGAARLWPEAKIDACDNDLEAVRVAARHFHDNALDDILVYQSDGYAEDSPLWQGAPFDLILANILSGPLIAMAADQARALKDGGTIILSGLLEDQASGVETAYRQYGLTLGDKMLRDGWAILTMKKSLKPAQ